MLTIRWRPLDFKHSCGLPGTILEVLVSSDGDICLSGLCAVCGKDFSASVGMVTAIRSCAIADYKQGDDKPNFNDLEHWEPPKGRVS